MSPLDQQRERIQDDLRGLVTGEVRCDDVFLQLSASDASIYEIRPQGVVRPRCSADVAACVQYAAQKRIPVHARGAGTGVAGESLGPGLCVDFSTHLHRIIRQDGPRVRVQAGIVHERLNWQLRRAGRLFGPDPTTSAMTTIGSMIAVDAAGSRRLKYGSTRRHVQSLQVVLADGQVLELGSEPLVDGQSVSTIPRKRDLINQVASLLRERADVIRQGRLPGPLSHCGYHLAGVLGDDSLDLAALLTGSEGTLALVTEALLNTDPLARHRGMALLMFDSVEKAARTALDILPFQPTACDLVDRRHISLAREGEPRFNQLIPSEAEAVLLVEQEGDDPLEIRDQVRRMVDELWHQKRLAFGARQAFEEEEIAMFWHLIDRVRPTLYRLKGPSRPVPVVDDVAVPPDAMADFVVRLQNVLKRNLVTAALFCHAGHGQLHIQPFLDLSNPEDVERMRRLADELYQEVAAVGGILGGEHACGLSRTPFLRNQAGPLYDVFVEVKRIFDPQNILNPGKIVGDDPELLTRYLCPPLQSPSPKPEKSDVEEPAAAAATEESSSPSLRNLVELQLNWDPARVHSPVSDCNRCGECRTQSPGDRMCPIFRFALAEEASPRAKANLIRGVLTGQLDLHLLTSDEFKTIVDLCVHCHSCRLECSAGVDVPRLMRESKGAFVAANGLSLADWAMTRLDLLGGMAGVASAPVNWALANRQMRWLLEKTFGISQGRKLPRVSARNFLRRTARRHGTRPSRRGSQKVLYFVDVYANYFDPQLADAAVAVLEHNGVAVYVPPEQRPAGMPSIAAGAIDHARRLAERNVATLAEAVRQGYHVVTTEPAAALCLRHEYPQLIDEDDARLVAAHSSDACEYLWQMHARGQLQLDFRPLNLAVGYHLPCHLRALDVGSPGRQLLGLIPGVRLREVEAGCCGMAGTYGLLHKNYRNSLRAGWKLISRLRDPSIQAGATECSACKIQMEQGAAKPTLHPVKLLALAYGLMPEVARLLVSSGEEWTAT
ncbi:MAG: anaerobic glycerol-3-phosphate dehydrogenase subunit C [Planctomycetaceae bacterium]|nr:anaerobic glycerol-3-phosphate dehydrogenase subunit C [Planctomycetaceae bacterium]